MADDFAVYANIVADKVLRAGAKVEVFWQGGDRARVHGLNKGGRRVLRWVPLKSLTNFRAGWCRETDGPVRSREAAEQQAAVLNGTTQGAQP